MKRFRCHLLCLALLASGTLLGWSEGQKSPAQLKIDAALQAIRQNPGNYDLYNKLALAQARRARETADPKYYEFAEQSLENSLRLAPENLEAERIRVWVLLGKHEFASALERATTLNRRIPDDVMTYAFLTDANVELGNYEAAERAAQWMLDLRPGNVPGLTRAAYLRELFGDIEGAIQLMEDAYQRTPNAEFEDRAWTLTQLAHLHLISGRVERAEALLRAALSLYPDYHYALAGLGKVRMAQSRFEEAVQTFENLYRVAPHPENLYLVAKSMDRAGGGSKALAAWEEFEQKALAESMAADNSNRELIYYFVDVAGKPSEALRIAQIEKDRKRDAATLEASAWALRANDMCAEAQQEMDAALHVGIQDAVSFYHAGVIARECGNAAEAEKYFRLSLKANPHSDAADTVRKALAPRVP
jgi:tetratricopeptide (TPR) repeat protein